MYRVGVAGLIHETNTFSTIPTHLDNFLKPDGFYPELRKGNEIFKFQEGRYNIASSGFLARARVEGFDIAPLTWCGAEPSAPVSGQDFEVLLGFLLEALKSNLPMDGLYLDLHGAMVYGDLQDGETEILERIRAVVGDLPIVVSLDLHGNIDPQCFELATAMVGYRTYPHVDAYETGERCAILMTKLLGNEPLGKAFRQLPFLMPSTTQPTTRNPAKEIYEYLDALEKTAGVASISLMEGFPPCDLPHTGPSLFTYAGDALLASQIADQLLEFILDREEQFQTDLYPAGQAVAKAIQLSKEVNGPVIMADIQDNAGGGSPSDSTWLLEEMIKQQADNAAIGLIFDPGSAQKAFEAGEGSELSLSIGGHSLPGHRPLEGTFRVVKVHGGDFIASGPMLKDRVINLGKMAHLLIDGIHVIVSSVRMQAMDQSQFRVVGIEPASLDILALKSANHYRADFGPISGGIINVEAPSAIIEDPSRIPYTRLREGVRLKGLGPEFHSPNKTGSGG